MNIKVKKESLAESHPYLLEIWDYDKNNILPTELTFGSHKKVYWKCLDDPTHSYLLSVNSKTNNKNRCPQCAGSKPSTNNNFAVKFPQFLIYWDYEKNTVSPEDITPGSHSLQWFKCPININHPTFQVKINSIYNYKSIHCPECYRDTHIGIDIKKLDTKTDKNNKNIILKRIKAIKTSAIHRKPKSIEWNLTRWEAANLIIQPCFYCCRKLDIMGIDRINNNIGYHLNNCVPSCKFCNSAKRTMTIEKFINWIENIGKSSIIQPLTDKDIKPIEYRYKNNAKIRNKIWELSYNDIQLLIPNNCFYCRQTSKGIDRIDNNFGYIKNNCVPCCKICNYGKLTQTYEDFTEMLNGLQYNLKNIKLLLK